MLNDVGIASASVMCIAVMLFIVDGTELMEVEGHSIT
jgi:hypothetical protein